jgi:hypothetical protein
VTIVCVNRSSGHDRGHSLQAFGGAVFKVDWFQVAPRPVAAFYQRWTVKRAQASDGNICQERALVKPKRPPITDGFKSWGRTFDYGNIFFSIHLPLLHLAIIPLNKMLKHKKYIGMCPHNLSVKKEDHISFDTI